jgi:DNA-binding CsgD family transcriptional regulator
MSTRDPNVALKTSARFTVVAQGSPAGGTSALSAIQQAAIAIDHFGYVLEANGAAEALFDNDFYIRNRRLIISDSNSRRYFEALTQKLDTLPDTDALSGTEPMVIRRGGKHPIIAKVLPVPAAARNAFHGARALLTFGPVGPKPRPNASLLSRAFGLTSAEAKLAATLADGTSLKEAAKELTISSQTARTQLKTVFMKTDTHRQSQLVALLLPI